MARRAEGTDDLAPKRGRATIVDIAREAGVHWSTVSRALNPGRQHLVAKGSGDRIREVAERMGYRHNALASGLRTQRSFTIGVVVSDLADPTHPPIVRAIEDRFGAEGYVILVGNTDNDLDRQKALIERLIRQGVDGLVVATFRRQDQLVELCLGAQAPTVAVLRVPEDPRLSAVATDDVKAMELAVAHLAERGHTDIAHLGGPLDVSTGFDRGLGFHSGFARHFGKRPTNIVHAKRYSIDEGRKMTARLLEGGRITGIVAANDLLAIGCLLELRQRSIDCPAEISVIGMNDMPFGDITTPALTTVRSHGYEMGTEAANLLLRLMDDPGMLPERVILRPHLVIRGSTAQAVSEG